MVENSISKKKVIIIEFFNYHTECIYSQVLYLTKSEYEVEVICSTNVIDSIKYINELGYIKVFDFKKMLSYFKLWWYLIKQKNTSTVIINTAQGSRVLKFMVLPFLGKIKFYGIIHNLKKIETSKGQKLISRKIFKYLVIADYLEHTSIAISHKISAINTNIFPTLFADDTVVKKNEIWIVVPGNIENKRRNYKWLINICAINQLNKSIKFILLGNSKKGDGKEIIQMIIDLKLEKNFIWFDSFIKQETFNTYIELSDYLLPLLDENNNEYLNYKISGTFSISQAFSKPMILHSNFKILESYYCCLFYNNVEEFIDLISSKPLVQCKPFDFNKNRLNYINVLNIQ